MNNSFDEHNDIVEAIARGDSDAAAEILRSHVAVQGERFADLIASLASMNPEKAADPSGGALRRSA